MIALGSGTHQSLSGFSLQILFAIWPQRSGGTVILYGEEARCTLEFYNQSIPISQIHVQRTKFDSHWSGMSLMSGHWIEAFARPWDSLNISHWSFIDKKNPQLWWSYLYQLNWDGVQPGNTTRSGEWDWVQSGTTWDRTIMNKAWFRCVSVHSAQGLRQQSHFRFLTLIPPVRLTFYDLPIPYLLMSVLCWPDVEFTILTTINTPCRSLWPFWKYYIYIIPTFFFYSPWAVQLNILQRQSEGRRKCLLHFLSDTSLTWTTMTSPT